jgi:hypothetical protein
MEAGSEPDALERCDHGEQQGCPGLGLGNQPAPDREHRSAAIDRDCGHKTFDRDRESEALDWYCGLKTDNWNCAFQPAEYCASSESLSTEQRVQRREQWFIRPKFQQPRRLQSFRWFQRWFTRRWRRWARRRRSWALSLNTNSL